MAKDYIDKLNNGQPISKVFTSSRETPYRFLYIVSARTKEALLYCSEESKTFLSEWYDHIDDFDNFIYTKVHIGGIFNYIYHTGKLVSPYWSDEMSRMGQVLWPIVFNGKYNFIKNDGSLLLQEFGDGIWADEKNNNISIIRASWNHYSYCSVNSEGESQSLWQDTKYDRMSILDVYSSKLNITDSFILHRRLFSLTVEDSCGKELLPDVLNVIKYNVRPITDLDGVSEGDQGILFSVRKKELAGKEELLLLYNFATIKCVDAYRVLCFSTDSFLPDKFEAVQVLRSLHVLVRKDGAWNIIDKFGDYVSKELWFDSIELMNNGNAVVKKGEKYNFLKSNGILLSSEWYDEINHASETGKFVVRQGKLYNVIDNNLRFANYEWQETTEGLPSVSEKKSPLFKNKSNIQPYDQVWMACDGDIVECYVLSSSPNKLTILWPLDKQGDAEVRVIENCSVNAGNSIQTSMGQLYFNKP